MKYRIKQTDENNVMIDDAIEIEERLMMGYGVAYGLKVGEKISISELFRKIKKAISKRTIYRLDRRGEKMFISWVEMQEGHPIFHDDEFDATDVSSAFFRELGILEDDFTRKEALVKEGIVRKILKRGSATDLFVRCSNYLKATSKHRKLNRDLSVREAEELFEYIIKMTKIDGVDLLEYVPRQPMFGSVLSGMFYKGFDKLIGVIVLPLIATMVSTGAMWLAGLVGILYVTFVLWFSNLYLKKEDESKKGYLVKLIRKMENVYGLSQSSVLDRQIRGMQGKSFVEFIYDDLDFIEANPSYGCDTEQFKILAWEYSSLKEFEVFYGREQVDKADFLTRLADVEIEMYAKNPSFGFVNNKENIAVGVDTLESRLGLLGWSREKINDDLFTFNVVEMIEEVLKCPYEGCEVELTRLIQLACKYVDNRNKVFFKENELIDFHKVLKEVEDIIADKILECKRLDEMVEREDGYEVPEVAEEKIDFRKRYNLGV